jgi:hypothetical protein
MVEPYSKESGNIRFLNEIARVSAMDPQKPSITFTITDHSTADGLGLKATIERDMLHHGFNTRVENWNITFWGEKALCYLATHGVKFEGQFAYRQRARELGLATGLPGQEQWSVG